MSTYVVYEADKRPWPDEVNLLNEEEMREKVNEAAQKYLRNLTTVELANFAEQHLSLVVDIKS